MRSGFGILFLLVFAGCATPTPYQPANYLGYGYTSNLLDSQTARIGFKGNKLTDRAEVELMLIYRAAEVTKDNGFTYFKFNKFETDRQSWSEQIAPQTIVRNRNGRLIYYWNDPWNQNRSGQLHYNEYEGVAYVSMSQEKQGDQSFKAAEVLKNLAEKIMRDETRH